MATLKKLKSHPIAIEAQAKSVPPPFNVIKTDVKGHLASSYDLGALEGLRAVAALAIICFHCFLYWGTLLPLPKGHKVGAKHRIFKYPPMRGSVQ